jgi:uncharacterized phiE125 gp8 family phage protein
MREVYAKTDAAEEPVTASEISTYVNYGGTDAGTVAMLYDIATAARIKLEHFTGRNFVEKTMVLNTDDVKMSVPLPYGPIYEVVSVKVYDTYGVLDDTLTADDDYYLLGDFDKWVRIESFFTGGYVKIEYKAGYGSNTFALPDAIKTAILKQAKFDYDHRGATDVPVVLPEVQNLLIAYQCSFL